jgi:uncharacterized protein YjbI with pentapeptide repeats
MKRLADFRKHVMEGWTVQRIAAVLIVVGLVVFVFGAVTQYCVCTGWPNLGDVLNHMIGDFYANVSVDCLSIAFAILVIDRLNERRAEQEFKVQLIREMGSSNNGIALRAVGELEAHNWHDNGSLREVSLPYAGLRGAVLRGFDLQQAGLRGASLQNADFTLANLRRADLSLANLQEARLVGAALQEAQMEGANLRETRLRSAKLQEANGLTDQQLILAHDLRGATLPNCSLYDGRFSLWGDMRFLAKVDKVSITSPQAMARYYSVPLEDYLAGQEWAREHLADLRREAGLDPDTGLPLPPTNGTEPPPADVPAPPALRRYGHKASMVTHRVRR